MKFKFFAKCNIEFRSFYSSFICVMVSNTSWMIKLCENVPFEIIYAANLLLQNMTKVVCLHWLTFDIFSCKPWRSCWITCANFSKSEQFSTRSISETKSGTPIFLRFLTQVTHYLTAVKIFNRNLSTGKFSRKRLYRYDFLLNNY